MHEQCVNSNFWYNRGIFFLMVRSFELSLFFSNVIFFWNVISQLESSGVLKSVEDLSHLLQSFFNFLLMSNLLFWIGGYILLHLGTWCLETWCCILQFFVEASFLIDGVWKSLSCQIPSLYNKDLEKMVHSTGLCLVSMMVLVLICIL